MQARVLSPDNLNNFRLPFRCPYRLLVTRPCFWPTPLCKQSQDAWYAAASRLACPGMTTLLPHKRQPRCSDNSCCRRTSGEAIQQPSGAELEPGLGRYECIGLSSVHPKESLGHTPASGLLRVSRRAHCTLMPEADESTEGIPQLMCRPVLELVVVCRQH